MTVKRMLVAIAAAVMFHAVIVRAEIMIVDSLEWEVADSPPIVQARVADLTESRGRNQVIYRDLKLADVKVLKGDAKPENLALRLRVLGDDPLGKSCKTSGDTYIFFLEPGKKENDSEMGGYWVLRDREAFIDLDHPARVYTAAMKEETARDEILKIISAYKDWKKDATPVGAPNIFKPQREYVRMEIMFDSPIYKHIFAGSACYINVPADEKTHETVLKLSRSEEVWDRIRAADMLVVYPGPETTKILTGMLEDAATSRTVRNNSLVSITYPVRQVAYNTLVQLGENPTKPVLERVPTQQELDAEKKPAQTNP